MNKQFLTKIEGRADGNDILEALKITNKTKPNEVALAGVDQAIALVDEGKTPQEAAQIVLKSASKSVDAVVDGDERDAVLDLLNAQAKQTVGRFMAVKGHLDQNTLQDMMETYHYFVGENFKAVMGSGVVEHMAQDPEIEVQDLLGKSPSLLDRAKALKPANEIKSLPSS